MSEPPVTGYDGVVQDAPPPASAAGRKRRPVAMIVLVAVTGAMLVWLLADSFLLSGRSDGEYESTRVVLPSTLLGLARQNPALEAELAAAAAQQSNDIGQVSAAVYGSGAQTITVTAIRPSAPLSAADHAEVLAGFAQGLEDQTGDELTYEEREPGDLGGTLSCLDINDALACVALDPGSVVIVAVLAGGDAGLDTVRATRAAVVTRD